MIVILTTTGMTDVQETPDYTNRLIRRMQVTHDTEVNLTAGGTHVSVFINNRGYVTIRAERHTNDATGDDVAYTKYLDFELPPVVPLAKA